MKIRAKLLVPIYWCILLWFIAVWVSIYIVVYQNSLQSWFDHLNTRTELKETEVHNFISGLTENLSEFSSSTENIDLIKLLSKYQRDTSSRIYKDTFENLENNIRYFQTLYPEIQDIIFTDVFGIIVYALSEEKIWTFIENDYWKGFLNRSQAELFISDIRLKNQHNAQSSFIFASKPILESTWVIGSLIIEMDSKKLDKILSEWWGLWETWETYIIGRDWVIKTERINFHFTKFSTRINPYTFGWCFESNQTSWSTKQYINIIWEKVIWDYKYIPEIDMCLITEIYEKEVFKTAKNILFIMLAWSIAIFLSISLLISTFIKNITSPLLYLTKKVKEVTKWNKNIELNIESNDEIWDLTGTFQEMLKELSITDDRIQKKVDEQTKEIKNKQKESEKLNKDLLKFQEALKKASDYIAILDIDIRVVYINTSLEHETGYNLKECIWKHTYDLWRSKEDINKIRKIWKQVSNTKKSFTVEMLTSRKDGTHFISEVHISPILNEKWKIIFFLTIENDITQEKAVKKMKDDFISLVSHELRTPMSVIRGFSKILLDESFWSLNTKQKNYLWRIDSNVNYLIAMVNDMLDIEKLNSGKMEFKYTEFDIHSLLKDIKIELWFMCKEKKITLSLSGKKRMVNTDKEKVKQVLINLINNAYKFTEEKWSIKLKLSQSKKYLKVEVVDTWIWIKKENFWKIFEKFWQVDGPLQKTQEWTWLGLNICKLIIEELGWKVWFSSTYEKWSNFYFTLPL